MKRWDGMGPLPGKEKRVRNASPELIKLAVKMRDAPTKAEAILWNALRERQLGGMRWRFQHPVEVYILDFYCPACKLVVELDGSIHDLSSVAERDEERQRHLEAYGYKVLRFRNAQVEQNLPEVQEQILMSAGH